jgi:hypothetical protein
MRPGRACGGGRASGVLVKEKAMEANGMHEASGMVPGGEVLDGTDLEIVCGLQGDDLTLWVNKGGLLVFRALMLDAATDMDERRLLNFNSFAPDMVFRVGDTHEGLERMLASAGMGELVAPQKRGFIRWLLGR